MTTSPSPILRRLRTLAVCVAVAGVVFGMGAGGCGRSDQYEQRQEQSKKAASQSSLEKTNLAAKLKIDNDPNRVGYVYLMSFSKPIGYYVIKGKISSNGSQIEPEDLIDCPWSQSAESCNVIDGPQDDGTYGQGDPGIFFFTTDGTMIVWSGDYLYSTQPIATAIDVPKLG